VIVTTFEPASSGIAAVQFVVPVAIPLPPRSVDHLTCVTPTLSFALPPIVSGDEAVENVVPVVGVAIDTIGVMASVVVVERVTVIDAVPVLPAASRAVIVMTFAPVTSGIPAALQLVVPVAVPLPPRSLDHVTWVTPTLSAAEPLKRIVDAVMVVPVVGVAIDTVGRVVSPAGAVMTHENVCEAVRTLSEARAVTVYVPAVVPAPETSPVLV
jgi:hypothetical protein